MVARIAWRTSPEPECPELGVKQTKIAAGGTTAYSQDRTLGLLTPITAYRPNRTIGAPARLRGANGRRARREQAAMGARLPRVLTGLPTNLPPLHTEEVGIWSGIYLQRRKPMDRLGRFVPSGAEVRRKFASNYWNSSIRTKPPVVRGKLEYIHALPRKKGNFSVPKFVICMFCIGIAVLR